MWGLVDGRLSGGWMIGLVEGRPSVGLDGRFGGWWA